MQHEKYCISCLRVEGEQTDPDQVSRLFGVEGDRVERRDGVNVLTGLWRRYIDTSHRRAMEPDAQLDYWRDFLAAREDAVRNLQATGSRISVEFQIQQPATYVNLSPAVMHHLGRLGIQLRFRVYGAVAAITGREAKKLVWRPVPQFEKVTQYLLKQLDGTVLRERVRAKMDTSKGRFFVILPGGVESERIENWAFTHPDYRLGYPLDPNALLYDVVKRFLRFSRASRVLGQAATAGQGEPEYSARNLVISHGFFGSELRGPDVSDADIDELSYDTGRYPFILYFYRSVSPKRTTLDNRAVDEIAENLVGLAVGALDEDTYLMWWRTDLAAFPGRDTAL